MSKLNLSKDKLTGLIKFIIAVGLIYWLVNSGHLNLEKLQVILSPVYLPLCLVIILANLLMANFRWWTLLRAYQFDISFFQSVKLQFIGLFFNYAMPGSVGGDLVKGFYISKYYRNRKVDAAMSVFMDRIIGFYAMLCLALSSLFLNWEYIQNPMLRKMFVTTGICFLIGSTGLFMSFSNRVRNNPMLQKLGKKVPGHNKLFKLYNAAQTLRAHPKYLVATFFQSIAAQLLAILFFIVVGHALGEEITLVSYVFAVPLGFIASALPIAPAGVGFGQLAFLYFFKVITGAELQVGTVGITLMQMLLLLYSFLGAFYYLKQKDKFTQEPVNA